MKHVRYTPITKIEDADRIIKGPVLRPEVRDRQGTIISKEVIKQAAHDFMRRLHAEEDGTKPGFMHTAFKNIGLEIVESFVLDTDVTYPTDARLSQMAIKNSGLEGEDGGVTHTAGTWMLAMHVSDDRIWEGVLKGTYKGFSIGGDAMAIKEEE